MCTVVRIREFGWNLVSGGCCCNMLVGPILLPQKTTAKQPSLQQYGHGLDSRAVGHNDGVGGRQCAGVGQPDMEVARRCRSLEAAAAGLGKRAHAHSCAEHAMQ